MIKEGKFGSSEAISICTIILSANILYSGMRKFIEDAGTAVWMSYLISILSGFIGFTFLYLLLKKYPSKNITEIYEIVYGRLIGAIISLLTALLFLYMSSIYIRQFSELLKSIVLRETSINLLILFFILCVVTESFLGLEAMARFAKISSYLLLTSILLLILLSLKGVKLTNIYPILGNGLNKTIVSGLYASSIYGAILVLGVFSGSLQGIVNIRKAGYSSIIISGILQLANVLIVILTFPYFSAAELKAPMYTVSRTIEFGKFFERLDPVFMITLSLSAMISLSFLFYTSISIYSKTFRIQDKRPVIVPYAILSVFIALAPRNDVEIEQIYIKLVTLSSWIICFVPSFIGLIISIFKTPKKGVKKCIE